MNLHKLTMRTNKLSDMPVVAIIGGKKYKVLTAKKFRNPRRVGHKEYFGIVLGAEIEVLSMKEPCWFAKPISRETIKALCGLS